MGATPGLDGAPKCLGKVSKNPGRIVPCDLLDGSAYNLSRGHGQNGPLRLWLSVPMSPGVDERQCRYIWRLLHQNSTTSFAELMSVDLRCDDVFRPYVAAYTRQDESNLLPFFPPEALFKTEQKSPSSSLERVSWLAWGTMFGGVYFSPSQQQLIFQQTSHEER